MLKWVVRASNHGRLTNGLISGSAKPALPQNVKAAERDSNLTILSISIACRARSLLKNYGSLDCERGGCDDEARRPTISVRLVGIRETCGDGNGPQGMQAFAAGRQAEGCGQGPSQPTKSARPPRPGGTSSAHFCP